MTDSPAILNDGSLGRLAINGHDIPDEYRLLKVLRRGRTRNGRVSCEFC